MSPLELWQKHYWLVSPSADCLKVVLEDQWHLATPRPPCPWRLVTPASDRTHHSPKEHLTPHDRPVPPSLKTPITLLDSQLLHISPAGLRAQVATNLVDMRVSFRTPTIVGRRGLSIEVTCTGVHRLNNLSSRSLHLNPHRQLLHTHTQLLPQLHPASSRPFLPTRLLFPLPFPLQSLRSTQFRGRRSI